MARPKVEYRSASRENYKNFCKVHPDLKITSKRYYELLYSFSHRMRDYILKTGEKVQLPYGMGELSINKRRTRKFNKYNKIILPIDWPASKKEGKRIYIFNEHTEGYSFKWIWFRQKARFKLSDFWVFKPSRITSRMLSKTLKDTTSSQHLYRQYRT